MKFSEMLKKYMAMCDVSRDEAANRLQVSRSSINHWSAGKSEPKSTTRSYCISIMNVEMTEAFDRWNRNMLKAMEQ